MLAYLFYCVVNCRIQFTTVHIIHHLNKGQDNEIIFVDDSLCTLGRIIFFLMAGIRIQGRGGVGSQKEYFSIIFFYNNLYLCCVV